jgi:hypothetical protein
MNVKILMSAVMLAELSQLIAKKANFSTTPCATLGNYKAENFKPSVV